ncbi:MAG: radical SAM protein [Elusimicrobiota bacterium]|jgi:MoaA/NifB/PqqE/SkfB family radical SAM enzyme
MGLLRSLPYLRHLVVPRRKGPLYLILYVTDRCNLRCAHCYFSAELNKGREMPLEDIERLARGSRGLMTLAIGGGEPFLRKDLPEIIGLFRRHAGVQAAGFPTNGMLTDAIAAQTERILRENPGLRLNVSVSLDGRREVHERVRGVPGCWDKAQRSLEVLEGLRGRYGNLNIGVTCTLTRANRSEVGELLRETVRRRRLDHFQVNLYRDTRYGDALDASLLEDYVGLEREVEAEHAAGRLRGYNFPGGLLYTAVNRAVHGLVADTLRTKTCRTACRAAELNAVVYPDGRVYACEVRSDLHMGSLREHGFDLGRLWASPAAAKARAAARAGCFCTFECQMITNALFNPDGFARVCTEYARLQAGRLSPGSRAA